MRMSWIVLSSAWPIWRLPVTFGGGMTMVNGSASGRSGRNRPFSSQWPYQRASIAAGSKVLGSSVMEWRLDEGRAAGEAPSLREPPVQPSSRHPGVASRHPGVGRDLVETRRDLLSRDPGLRRDDDLD